MIKKILWVNSSENENLIAWVAAQAHNDQYNVAECYERMWDELISAVIWHRREKSMEKQHFKLLDWMEKKKRG